MTIELPGDLYVVSKMLDFTLTPIDEDRLRVHSRSWLDASKTFQAMVDYPPSAVKGTLWDPSKPSGKDDRAITAFTRYWQAYPKQHYSQAATQAAYAALALNRIAHIISCHKVSAINILKSVKDSLSRTYHLLGAAHDYWGVHTGHETAATESADRLAEDQTTMLVGAGSLKRLRENTRVQIDHYVEFLNTATATFDFIAGSAEKATAALPDHSYTENLAKFPDPLDQDGQ